MPARKVRSMLSLKAKVLLLPRSTTKKVGAFFNRRRYFAGFVEDPRGEEAGAENFRRVAHGGKLFLLVGITQAANRW